MAVERRCDGVRVEEMKAWCCRSVDDVACQVDKEADPTNRDARTPRRLLMVPVFDYASRNAALPAQHMSSAVLPKKSMS